MKIRPTKAERELQRELSKERPKSQQKSTEIPQVTSTPPLPPVPIVVWHDMYRDGWRDAIVPKAFTHPAKMARGLVRHIFDHLFAMRAIERGSIVLDPFGGVGTTGIEAAWRGCQAICIELEPKFVELAKENFELHRRNWQHIGCPLPMIIQGDSRQLQQHVQVAFDAIISSPPFGTKDSASAQSITTRTDKSAQWIQQNTGSANREGYGVTEGQMAEMDMGTVDAIISSPPYAELPVVANETGGGNYPQHLMKQAMERKARGEVGGGLSDNHNLNYGTTEGQLSGLKPGHVDAVVSSPPYAETLLNDDQRQAPKGEPLRWGTNEEYGTSPGQLGQMKDGDGTFWNAARDIVMASLAVLKPGGHAVWVVKKFIRNKNIVDFDQDWRKLCEHCGFETLTEVHAMFTKDLGTHTDLIQQEDVTIKKERKSFFRRLAERKGSPRIDYETIYIMRKR